jgi:hypothetical protein
VAPSSAFAAADICIWKDGSATQKASAAGITVTSPFDSIVGLHLVEIDTSNNTDTGFWTSGSVYTVRIVTAKTVATYSVSGLLIGEFSLEVQTADVRKFGGTAGAFGSGRPEVNVTHIGGDAQSATDLKDFADAGYDPSTNKLTGAVELDSASRLAIWNTLTTETFTADSFGDLLIISDGTNGREVKVTGANHIAADVHDVQPDGLTASTDIIAIKAKTTNLPTDPADQSLVEAAITAATSPLATPAQVNAQVLDVLSVDTFGELSSPPAATSSLKDKLGWLFMWARNRSTQSATQRKLYADDATTIVSTETVGDDGATFTKGEAS